MSNHPAIEGLADRMAASWQARLVLCAMPLLVGRRAPVRCAAPDVAQVRARSHLLSLPGAWLAALLNPRSRRARDGGLDGLWTLPSTRPGPIANAILYLHGGGYYFGSSATHRAVTTALAAHSGAPVFAPDYRLAPEHPFPAALEDALHAYRTLIARGIAANSIVVAGGGRRAGARVAGRAARRRRGIAGGRRAVLALGRSDDDMARRARRRADHAPRDATCRADVHRRRERMGPVCVACAR